MAANLRFRRFSNPATLKTVSPPLLIEFLRPYQDDLARRGFVCSANEAIDYDALAAVLMVPDESVPGALLDALFFVDETSTSDAYE